VARAEAEVYLHAKFHIDPYPTVWPQYTNVTDRQTDRADRQDNGPIA